MADIRLSETLLVIAESAEPRETRARRIAEQHGGTLTGANHPDGGAVFRLRFPVESS